MLVALLMSLAAQAACFEKTTAGALVDAVGAAEAAFAAMDIEGFGRARESARTAVDCIGDPLTVVDAAAYHRLNALDGFVENDETATVSSFRASLALQPAFVLPSSLAPEGGPLHGFYEKARAQPSTEQVDVAPPTGHILMVDGKRATGRPTDRPAILQLQNEQGAVVWTAYLPAGTELPPWEKLGIVVAQPTAEELATAAGATTSGTDAAASGGAGLSKLRAPAVGMAVLAGAAYGVAAKFESDFETSTDYDELTDLRTRTNTAFFTSVGLGGAALVLGTVSFMTVTW
ncbi:MAG: hypothetical protein QGG40_21280 [Myxococcota bacterium]|jgi:hypothetical protein|nr:hypothetical protein [Myxococcota bacterium]